MGGMSRTSTTPIIHWPVARSVTSPLLPLTAPLATSASDPAMVPSGSPLPMAAPQGIAVPEGSALKLLESPMPQVQEVSAR
jgi:hypothetical protein